MVVVIDKLNWHSVKNSFETLELYIYTRFFDTIPSMLNKIYIQYLPELFVVKLLNYSFFLYAIAI